jgi:hypothetical protein
MHCGARSSRVSCDRIWQADPEVETHHGNVDHCHGNEEAATHNPARLKEKRLLKCILMISLFVLSCQSSTLYKEVMSMLVITMVFLEIDYSRDATKHNSVGYSLFVVQTTR